MSPSSSSPWHTHTHTHAHTHTHTEWWQRGCWKSPPLAAGLPLPLRLTLLHSQSLRDAATSEQFNSSLIHVLRVNGNKLSKLFEPPTGLRLRGRRRGGGMPQLLKRRVECDCQSCDGRKRGGVGERGKKKSVNRRCI